ncbi:hypothetical protein LguiA_029822 [Lonicera macranthoides]
MLNRALKCGNTCFPIQLNTAGVKFFCMISNCSSSSGRLDIWEAISLQRVTKSLKLSFSPCLAISRCLHVISKSSLDPYLVIKSLTISPQVFVWCLSKAKNHLRAAPVRVM